MVWVKTEISPLFEGQKGADVDAVVLACTHFPLLRDELKACVNQTVHWIDSGAAIAKRVEDVLEGLPEIKHKSHDQEIAFLVGPNATPVRTQAFNDFGFTRVIGLMS